MALLHPPRGGRHRAGPNTGHGIITVFPFATASHISSAHTSSSLLGINGERAAAQQQPASAAAAYSHANPPPPSQPEPGKDDHYTQVYLSLVGINGENGTRARPASTGTSHARTPCQPEPRKDDTHVELSLGQRRGINGERAAAAKGVRRRL